MKTYTRIIIVGSGRGPVECVVTDRRYQRKPKPTHPWATWKPGYLSSRDKALHRQPKKREPDESTRVQEHSQPEG